MIPKKVISFTLKEVFKYALLPNAILVTFLILIHWGLIAFWIYLNHGIYPIEREILIGLLSSILPVISYEAWGIKRFIKKAYFIIHQNIVSVWLDFFSADMAQKMMIISDPMELKLQVEWRAYLETKTGSLPGIIRIIVKLVARKIGLRKEFFDHYNLIQNKDEESLANWVHTTISNLLIEKSENVVPKFFGYLLILNTVWLAILWFF